MNMIDLRTSTHFYIYYPGWYLHISKLFNLSDA